jgi:hypothetical protein
VKKCLTAMLAVFLLTGLALAQESAAAQSAPHRSPKAIKISGRVSSDGRSFQRDEDYSVWTVTNADVMKDHEGHRVKLQAYVAAEKGEIFVISIIEKSEPRYLTKYDDSAFRR